jgi:Protein of unknown function (DUF1275)
MEDPGNSTYDQMLQQEEESKAVDEELSLQEEVYPELPFSDQRRQVVEQEEEQQQQQLDQQDEVHQSKKKEQERLATLRIKIGLAIAYSFITGWADVLAFVHFSAMSTAMTGNVVLLGAAIGGNKHLTTSQLQPLWFYPIVIACNITGAFVAHVLQKLQQRSGRVVVKKNGLWNRITTSTTCHTAAFSFCMSIAGAMIYIFTKSHLSVWLYAASFGAQNVFTSKLLGVSTAFMTINMQKAGELIATKLLLHSSRSTKQQEANDNTIMSREQLLAFLVPISAASATLAGAIFGGIMTGVVGFKGGSASLAIAILQQAPYLLSEVLLPSF